MLKAEQLPAPIAVEHNVLRRKITVNYPRIVVQEAQPLEYLHLKNYIKMLKYATIVGLYRSARSLMHSLIRILLFQ